MTENILNIANNYKEFAANKKCVFCKNNLRSNTYQRYYSDCCKNNHYFYFYKKLQTFEIFFPFNATFEYSLIKKKSFLFINKNFFPNSTQLFVEHTRINLNNDCLEMDYDQFHNMVLSTYQNAMILE